MDMVMESGMYSAAFSISGQKFTDQLQAKRQDFDAQFEDTFGLEAKVCLWGIYRAPPPFPLIRTL